MRARRLLLISSMTTLVAGCHFDTHGAFLWPDAGGDPGSADGGQGDDDGADEPSTAGVWLSTSDGVARLARRPEARPSRH